MDCSQGEMGTPGQLTGHPMREGQISTQEALYTNRTLKRKLRSNLTSYSLLWTPDPSVLPSVGIKTCTTTPSFGVLSIELTTLRIPV